MANIFSSNNPSQMYLDSLIEVLLEGDTVSPRGKAVKEIRPVIFEFMNPLNRVTFLKGRKVNPFFQQAEALWILAGRADVAWLDHYNRNMAQFSDDGEYFAAPYGERIRHWNLQTASGFIFTPMDQLEDVYKKILEDKYTRQAVAVIYNPLFDNAEIVSKDKPCNLILTFKVRANKTGEDELHLTVFNRSNDLHYGVFGANLCQFATIQETVAAWLGLPVGKYSQITDSLHVYLEDYGAKETGKVLEAYGLKDDDDLGQYHLNPEVEHFTFPDEPRISLDYEGFNTFLRDYFTHLDPVIHDDDNIMNNDIAESVVNAIMNSPDAYFKNTLLAMVAYRGHRLGNYELIINALGKMVDSQWKLSCLYFLYNSYGEKDSYKELYEHYSADKIAYIEGK